MPAITAPEKSEARIAKALAHPLRARILERLGERVSTPSDLADELDAPLGVVSYHVRMLRGYECIELVRTEPRRGALQHFYRAIARPNLDEGTWRSLPASLRGELSNATIEAIVVDLAASATAGALSDQDVVVTRSTLELDDRAIHKLNRVLSRTLEQALAIAAESTDRGSADVARTTLAIAHFNRADEARDAS